MKKRYVIEFTVEAEDFSDEWIKGQALQELTCMVPFPEDIDFYRKDNPWHTGTPTEDGWYLCAYGDNFYCANYWQGGTWKNQWGGTLLAYQKIELYEED